MSRVPPGPRDVRRSTARLLVTLLALLLLPGGCDRLAPAPADPLDELASAGIARRFEPRISVVSDHLPCHTSAEEVGSIPRVRCGERATPPPGIAAIAGRAAAAAEGGVAPGALHAVALLDLLWSDADGIALTRSISHLETVSRLSDRPAAALADLAAAYLIRAERSQQSMDLFRALEMADRAVAADPRDAAALFNLALATERAGLHEQAIGSWRAYLEVDPSSPWAEEARAKLDTLASRPLHTRAGPVPQPEQLTADDALAARYHGWDVLLAGWGEAALAGDEALAAARLALAERYVAATARVGGDGTLAEAVAVIRRHAGDGAALTRLARGHARYGAARERYRANDYAAARVLFDEALAAAPPSPALARWTRAFQAASMVYTGDVEQGEALLRRVRAEADPGSMPALAATERWIASATLLRTGAYERSMRAAREAGELFAAAGERELAGGAEYLAADAAFQLAAGPLAYEHAYRALRQLERHRGSIWLHNLLSVTAEAAATDGLPRAALRIQDEGIVVAERMSNPAYAIEARLGRARLLADGGDAAGAAREATEMGARIARLDNEFVRGWFTAERDVLRSGDAAGTWAASIEELEAAASYFERAPNAPRHLAALTTLAAMRLRQGDARGAALDLSRATALVEQQRRGTATAALGSGLLEAVGETFDRLMMLQIARGDTVEALATLDRGRALLFEDDVPERRWATPPGTVSLTYALIGDTLLVWTVDPRGPSLHRGIVDADGLRRTADRARAALELRADDAADRDLRALHDLLVAPVGERLGPPGTRLLVSVDGLLDATPFAALRDSHGRYLVEAHPLTFVTSVRGSLRERSPASLPTGALVVADPGFDRGAYPGFARLPGAAAEAAAVTALYPGSSLLRGAAAGRERVRRELTDSGLLHFAGHAVLDDARPERSYLLLASDVDGVSGDDGGRLTAADLAALDLRNLRLVVLSACQTLRSPGGRSSGFRGLSGALLSAGAGGVVGSIWRVDDAQTRELMETFHQRYRETGDGAAALREAQLALLRSSDARLRSPSAWAAFRFAGE